MPWYDLHSAPEPSKSLREYRQRVKYDEIICKRVKNFGEMVENDLFEGVQYRFVTERAFNAITVIKHFLQTHALTEVYFAVYRMDYFSVVTLMEIIDSTGIECGIVLSSFFRENKKYERWARELITYAEGRGNVRVNFAVNHAKVFLTKTADGKHIVFEGSGNLSDNARIEQYLLEDRRETYDFHKNWISEVLNQAPSPKTDGN